MYIQMRACGDLLPLVDTCSLACLRRRLRDNYSTWFLAEADTESFSSFFTTFHLSDLDKAPVALQSHFSFAWVQLQWMRRQEKLC
jgi:hypothetical protein